MMDDFVLYPRKEREYIKRIRRDPRMRAMLQGWVAQATAEAEQRYPGPYDEPARAHEAATIAVQLAMSFVLDNDGEYQAIRETLDKVLEAQLTMNQLSPRPLIIPKDAVEQTGDGKTSGKTPAQNTDKTRR